MTVARSPRLPRLLTLLALTLMSSNCGKGGFGAHDIRPLAPVPPVAARVLGIRDYVLEAQKREQPVRVLAVHGMRTNKPGFSELWQEEIRTRLGLQPGVAEPAMTVDRGYDIRLYDGAVSVGPPGLSESSLRVTHWYDAAGKDLLVFYELLWAPARDEIKNHLIACFESHKPQPPLACPPLQPSLRNQDGREWVNGSLKDGIMVDGFADATIILSPAADVLRDDVDQAMCVVARDILIGRTAAIPMPAGRCSLAALLAAGGIKGQQAGVAAEVAAAAISRELRGSLFFTITHSLGSFLVMDGQQRAMGARPAIGGNVVERSSYSLLDTTTVFMFANQVSLLELGRVSAMCTPRPAAPPGVCPKGALVLPPPAVPGRGTTYVAFNDANDLLGFELPPYLATQWFGRLVNVSVSNPAFFLPFIFKNPGGAHNNQGSNDLVMRSVVDGFCLPTAPGPRPPPC